MMKRIKSLVFLSLFLSLFACNQTSKQEQTENKTRKIGIDKNIVKQWNKQENNDLEIYYPPGWKFDSSSELGALFVIFAPLENKDDQFQENINLVMYQLQSPEIDLKEYYQASIENFKNQLQSFNIQKEEKILNNNIEIQKVIFTAVQDDFVMNMQQYYFLNDQKAYIMTFAAEEIKFDDYLEYVDLVMNSFKFKNKKNP